MRGRRAAGGVLETDHVQVRGNPSPQGATGVRFASHTDASRESLGLVRADEARAKAAHSVAPTTKYATMAERRATRGRVAAARGAVPAANRECLFRCGAVPILERKRSVRDRRVPTVGQEPVKGRLRTAKCPAQRRM